MGRRTAPAPTRNLSTVLKSGRNSRRRGAAGRRALRVIAVLVSVGAVAALLAGAVMLYLQIRVKGSQKDIGKLTPVTSAQPMNVLVLGSDSRAGLSAAEQKSFGDTGVVPGRRADTIMLLNLNKQKVVLVQFPRDLRVTRPDGTLGKINSVYAGGPEAMVTTVSRFTGLPINHYVEVDFNGFNGLTRALGGVKVYFERPVKDRDSGLDVPKGCVSIEGPQALAFVRARKIDDDFGRIYRQQLFLKLMVEKIAAPGTLLRPDRVISLVNVFSRNVTYDAQMNLSDIRRLALRLRGFKSGNLDMRVVPSAGARIGGTDFVVANEMQSRALFSAIASGGPLPPYGTTAVSAVDPAQFSVSLLNGTDVDKLAKNEAGVLTGKGYQVVETSNAPPLARTTVYYSPGFQDQARLLSKLYSAGLKPLPAALAAKGQVAVVLGKDFADARVPATSPGAAGIATPAAGETAPQSPAGSAVPVIPAKARVLVRPCDGK